MSETEWEDLRQRLCTQFPEDTVQTVLLKLHKFLSSGNVIGRDDAIYWCRTVAYRVKLNAKRDNRVMGGACSFNGDWQGSTRGEQELILLEDEVYARLALPMNLEGRPLTADALRARRHRARVKRKKLAA